MKKEINTYNLEIREDFAKGIENYKLPLFSEIPDIGLFLEQATKFVSQYLEPLGCISITGSMISNYVKKKIIDNPVKKQYYREQIAEIFFIGIAKSVLSLEEIQKLLEIRREKYDTESAYEYFCEELRNVLKYVFGFVSELEPFDDDGLKEKALLRKIIVAVAYKVYLSESFNQESTK